MGDFFMSLIHTCEVNQANGSRFWQVVRSSIALMGFRTDHVAGASRTAARTRLQNGFNRPLLDLALPMSGAYTEWFALFSHNSNTAKPKHFINGRLTFLITNYSGPRGVGFE